MARNTKRGRCELCGEVANVSTNHGSATCPKCTHVQAALANRLQAVAKAARAMGKAEDLIRALIPDGGSLAVQVTATLLQEISGIVGYDGEDPAELVEAVRKRALACASCEAEDVLHEIRQVIGYVPEQGDSVLVDAVRQLVAGPSVDCGRCTALRGDLLRACGLEMDDTEDGEGWDVAAAAAIQEIAQLTNRKDFWIEAATELKAQVTKLRAELTLVEQAHDEWEQRAVNAEANVETLEAEMELRNLEGAPAAPCASTTYLLDIALRALRGEGPDADQLASLIDAARRAA